MRVKRIVLYFVSVFVLWSCGSFGSFKEEAEEFNIFPVSYDLQIGEKMAEEIASNPKKYPMLSPYRNVRLYAMVQAVVDSILQSTAIQHKKEFVWKVHLLKDDSIVNAFVTPGGYIYVYTGLLKSLEGEHQLAGVLAHEIAHADRRHATRQLTKVLGVDILLRVALSRLQKGAEWRSDVRKITEALIGLSFTRADEREADAKAVEYLCPTSYRADGIAEFFQQLYDQPQPPEFLSSHPHPKKRVKNVRALHKKLQCKGKQTYAERYNQLKALLPRP